MEAAHPRRHALTGRLVEHACFEFHNSRTPDLRCGRCSRERVALGTLDLKLQPVAEGRPADVLLLDQNIGKDLLGTELAAAARARGFKGVTCVLTGSSKGEVARLGALPHVDVCAEKGTPIIELGARLSRALAAKRQATA